MDAFVDLDIAEMEALMQHQELETDATAFYSGESMFMPELFLSNNGASYDPVADSFEAEWLALHLAPDSLVSDAAEIKSDNIFTEDDDDDEVVSTGTIITFGGGGFAGFISTSAAIAMQAQLIANDNPGTEDEIIVTGQQNEPPSLMVNIAHFDGSTGSYELVFDVFGYPESDDGADFEDAENEIERLLFNATDVLFAVEWNEVDGIFIAQGPAF